MASMDRKMRLSRWDPVLLSGFARNVAAPSPRPKLQIRRPSTREPETPPLPSWLGSWVGLSDMRVKRQPLEKKQQPRGSETS